MEHKLEHCNVNFSCHPWDYDMCILAKWGTILQTCSGISSCTHICTKSQQFFQQYFCTLTMQKGCDSHYFHLSCTSESKYSFSFLFSPFSSLLFLIAAIWNVFEAPYTNADNRPSKTAKATSLGFQRQQQSPSTVKGDRKAKFFHHAVNSRRKFNAVHNIKVNGVVHCESNAVRKAIVGFYEKLYYEDCPLRSLMGGFTFESISDEEAHDLENLV